MIRIIEIVVKGIIKDCGRVREGYSVLLKIKCRLLFVPLIIRGTKYTICFLKHRQTNQVDAVKQFVRPRFHFQAILSSGV